MYLKVHADETYVGGKPRKRNKKDDDARLKSKRRHGMKKTPIAGAVQSGGQVVAWMPTNVLGRKLLELIRRHIKPDSSLLIIDEYQAYRSVRSVLLHVVTKHSQQFVDGNIAEGFWSLLKRARYDSHCHY